MIFPFASLPVPPAITIDQLRWMTGSWSCPKDGGLFEEHWLAPAGSMQGCGRQVNDGKTSFMEFMSIEADREGLVMWMLLGAPSKGEKKGVPFRLASFDGKTAIFENPANDFPTRIAYRLEDNSSLTCWIEGTLKGKLSREEFPFKRMKN